MSLNLNCLNAYEDIPLIINKSNNFIHPIYKPNGENFISHLSSLIIQSSFSPNDLQLLLKTPPINSWKLSPKFLSSLLIYCNVIVFVLILCSILFYLISYSNLNKFNSSKRFSLKSLCIILLNLIYLFLLIQMIFILQNINQSKRYLNQSIKQINQQFNSNIIEQYLLKQLHHFSSQSSSIIINGSKSLMIKSFVDYYSIDEINILINNINQHLNDFNSLIVNNEILNNFTNQFILSYKNIINLNLKLCDFINRNDNDQEIVNVVNLIQQQLKFFIQILNEQILNKINLKLLNNKQEEKVQSSISFIATLTMTIISILTIIPLPFLILINVKYLPYHSNHRITNSNSQNQKQRRLRSLDLRQLKSSDQNNDNQQRYSTHTFRHSDSTPSKNRRKTGERSYSLPINDLIVNKSNDHRSYHLFLCSIRIAFGLLLVLLIVLCLISSLLYGVDMFTQSCCRLVHYNQPFLISFITDNFLKSIDDFDVNTTVNNVIDDCNNKIHFSKKIFVKYSFDLTNEFIPIIKELNENIYHQFQISIQTNNIYNEIHLLKNLANLTGLTNIQNRLIIIEMHFYQIDKIFTRILEENSQLSVEFLNKTLNQFELFLKNVIESTIDSCPLPLDDIINLDEFICHKTGNTINGLWMKILFFSFFVGFAFCVFGIYIYKRLNENYS